MLTKEIITIPDSQEFRRWQYRYRVAKLRVQQKRARLAQWKQTIEKGVTQ